MTELLQIPEGAAFDLALEQGVLEISFNQPERRNPLGYGTMNGLVEVLRRASTEPDVRAILLYGQGPAFTAGGDLAEFKDEASESAHTLHMSGAALADLMTLIPRLPQPLVVAAHGYCMAGGLGLLASADVALGADSTTYSMSEIKIGLFPLMVLPPVSAAIGARQARELALTGRRFGSDEALRTGLIHQSLPDEDFVEAARKQARGLASLGSGTLAMGKQYLHDIDGLPLDNAVQFGRAVRGAFMASPDFAEGVSAFLEKRKPEFK
jgi:enoyl-CoA hydratase/carnithine racemase